MYTSGVEIDDYTELDVSDLTEDGTTEYIYISSNTEYYIVDSGALMSGSTEDVTEGDMIVASIVSGDASTIIVLSGTDESTDLSIDAMVAEITAIGDSSFTLIVYSLTEEGTDYVITDVAAVELVNYEPSSETEEISIDSAWVVWIVEDGVATEGTSEQIVIGDVIIIYTDSNGIENVVVYHSEEDDSDETNESEDTPDDETTEGGTTNNETTDDANDGTETEGDGVSEGDESTEDTNNE